MAKIYVDPFEFRKWLAQKATEGATFAAVPIRNWRGQDYEEFASWSCGCPLATYARERLGYPEAAWAGSYLYPIYRKDRKMMAPPWTERFVALVDRMGGPRRAVDVLAAFDSENQH